MKLHDQINCLRKDFVYEQYTRIVKEFKEYEKITKSKMLDAIYKVYSDYNNIISICTTKELKYLEQILNSKEKVKSGFSFKRSWEEKELYNKFLIVNDHQNETISIPEEIVVTVKEALKNLDWNIKKKVDDLNEFLVGFCKIQGSIPLDTLLSLASQIFKVEEEILWNHSLDDKLFNYYVFVIDNPESLSKKTPLAVYQDYLFLLEELNTQRKKYGLAGTKEIDIKMYKALFYNDFDENNPKIKEMLVEMNKVPLLSLIVPDRIKKYSLLNLDREELKHTLSSHPAFKDTDLTRFFELMDEAMDEIPSGALNGFTPKEANEIKLEEKKIKLKKEINYKEQKNACLSKKDADLFYKIYLALLDFTNKKYSIKSEYKIYKKKGLNPHTIVPVIEKFWENKETIVLEFCNSNSYKFTEEEKKLANNFKNGYRSIFIFAEFAEEFTAVIDKDQKVYMIKGIRDNLDKVIPFQKLPYPVITSIIPFKNFLVYDGILQGMEINLDNSFNSSVQEILSNSIKYYHI